ncbi:MAG: CubicO group peptidase (beta-lactamase class C family) [Phenylobacterium sp.]|jgi:CubicO group peptidase (beta-lactamase class C family)
MKIITNMLTFLLFVLISISTNADETPAISAIGPTDQAELLAFIDQWISKNNIPNNRKSSPGISISLVQNGQVMLSKGYGIGNIDTKEVVTANSVFRIASISKVFVGLAAAQLVEKGQLDLDKDVNHYLTKSLSQSLDRFQLSHFAAPVTLRHLLSHTAGFDEQVWSDLTIDPDQQQTLGEHLAQMLPPLVREPGRMYSYSNYGYALAAYLVEIVSGQSFTAYVDQHILNPLNMNHSGYMLTEALRPHLVTGYQGDEPRPYTYVHRYPATSMMTSANDMARFMAAMLNTDSNKLYGKKAGKLISTALYTADPSMPGQTAGFMQWNRWGQTILRHDGGHVGFNAELMLFPKLNSGFFISINNKKSSLASDLKYALLYRYYKPANLETLTGPFTAISNHQALEGEYTNSRRAHGNIAKMFNLIKPGLTIRANDNGTINAFGSDFVEQSEDLFTYIKRPDLKLKVVRKADGEVDFIAFDYAGSPRAFEKLSGFHNVFFHRVAFCLTLAVMLLVSLYALFGRMRTKLPVDKSISLLVLPSGLNVLFAVLISIRMATIDSLYARMGDVPELWLILCLPLLAIALFLFAVVKGIVKGLVKRHHDVSWIGKAVILANLTFFIELYYWQLLGFHFVS